MIFVDQLTAYPGKPHGHRRWAHMWADGDIEELHRFAEGIGLKRAWFQDKPALAHYDVTPEKHKLAIKNGAVVKGMLDWFREQRVLKGGVK